mgnify:CR=1 FL=1
MDYYALVSIVDVFIKLGIVLVLPYVGYDKLLFYGLLLTIVGFANFLFYLVYARKNFSQIHIAKITDKSAFKSILSFSGWNVFGTFAYFRIYGFQKICAAADAAHCHRADRGRRRDAGHLRPAGPV